MIDILREGPKIIAYGSVGFPYDVKDGQSIEHKYTKPWPTNSNGEPLPKNLCYWNVLIGKVEIKTQAMLDAEAEEKETDDLKVFAEFLNKIIYDCSTFEDFKTKIEGLI